MTVQAQVAPHPSGDSVVRASDLRTRFGSEVVLDGVSFDIKRGEFACLLGPSGCGKSTFLRIAGNLLTRYEGETLIDGLPPSQAWSKIAYVFQSPRLVPWRTALGNVMMGMQLRYSHLSRPEARRRALEALDMVGLARDANKFPAILSGGERQRVSIARALAVDPEIIFMDEPLSALDAKSRSHLRDEILRIWRDTKKSVLFVTHDVDEALYLADRLIVFSNKPTTVLQDHRIRSPRPRTLDTDATLRQMKMEVLDQLGASFRQEQPE